MYLSLFWELRDKRNLKNLQFWPEGLGATLEYRYISNVAYSSGVKRFSKSSVFVMDRGLYSCMPHVQETFYCRGELDLKNGGIFESGKKHWRIQKYPKPSNCDVD